MESSSPFDLLQTDELVVKIIKMTMEEDHERRIIPDSVEKHKFLVETIAKISSRFRPDILFLKHNSSIFRQSSNPVCCSWKSQASSAWAKPVLHGPNSTESNLFHHGETTYRVG